MVDQINPCPEGGILGYHSYITWQLGGILGYQYAIFR